MSFSLRVVGWFAAVADRGDAVVAAPCAAQGVRSRSAGKRPRKLRSKRKAATGPNPLAVDPDLAIWTLVVFVILFAHPGEVCLAADCGGGRRAGAQDRRHDRRGQLRSWKRRSACSPSTRRSSRPRPARFAKCSTKPAATPKPRRSASRKKAARRLPTRWRVASVEIERATDAALQDLAVRSAKLAIELGERVVRDQLQISPEHQNRIVRDALEKLSAAAPSRN